MICDIYIPNKDRSSTWCFSLRFLSNRWYDMDVDDVCVLHARKDHDHAYYLEYFFYDTRNLGFRTFSSKKELYGAIQKLLEENVKR